MPDPVGSAGPGLDSGEFIALNVPIEQAIVKVRSVDRELARLRFELEHLVITVHKVYHGPEGVSKPPWRECRYGICRQAKKVLFESELRGDREEEV